MFVDFLIIGQGISGTFLSWYMSKAGIKAVVIDDANPLAASRVAAGVINPVTGRRFVETWLVDRLLPFAHNAYGALSNELGMPLLRECDIVEFFPTLQMRLAFERRVMDGSKYLALDADASLYQNFFHSDFGHGIIPGMVVECEPLLRLYRQLLLAKNYLVESRCSYSDLTFRSDYVQYRDVKASGVIFCDGIASAAHPLFSKLPFSPNKGEVLLVSIPELPPKNIYKRGIMISHLKEDVYWVGSSYEWEFQTEEPTAAFRERVTDLLGRWLRLPFQVVDHIASVRAATLERRPFVGYDSRKKIGILNGFGTKGCSLAPYFASELVDLIAFNKPIMPEADFHRFQNILLRSGW